MDGRRVLVSGMGSQLGSLVADRLEGEPWVGPVMGIDVDPPRRRLARASFHLIDPADRERVIETVRAFDPHVLIHLAVWEPDARATTTQAQRLTQDAAISILGACAEAPSLEAVVVRSGLEIYGRARHASSRPTEAAPIAPTSTFGRMETRVEQVAADIGLRAHVRVTALRLAPVLGPHVPSPLGRILRMAVVPYSLLADPPFAVLLESEAAEAFVRAAASEVEGPLNVAGPGAITTMQAIVRGKRVPLPLIGPEWAVVRPLALLTGSPVPDHVQELLHRGRLCDQHRCGEQLGWQPSVSASEVIDRMYRWEHVVRVPPRVQWEVAS